MTPDPKTPAQRLARVRRMLAQIVTPNKDTEKAQDLICYAETALNNQRRGRLARQAENCATAACRAAGIDPESIQ